MGKSKPRVLAPYTELTSLQKGHAESITDYVLRAGTAAASLKSADEIVSDSLLIAMVMKGLPEDYKTFSAIVLQRDEKEDKMKFQEFKVALRSYEETEKSSTPSQTGDNSVMNCKQKNLPPNGSVTYYTVVSLNISRHSAGLWTRRIRRKKATDGAATAGRRVTIRKYVVRKTPQKP